ncbi:hypothetical protein TrLO_g2419 [Triparma laevis f. longispina]|nr:hypothetical protein TrLO_g2419 [Triparma laevis f. longispina]
MLPQSSPLSPLSETSRLLRKRLCCDSSDSGDMSSSASSYTSAEGGGAFTPTAFPLLPVFIQSAPDVVAASILRFLGARECVLSIGSTSSAFNTLVHYNLHLWWFFNHDTKKLALDTITTTNNNNNTPLTLTMRTVSELIDLYIRNPCVPLDMSLVSAIEKVSDEGSIVIRHGHYTFNRTLVLARSATFSILGDDEGETILELITNTADAPLIFVKRGTVTFDNLDLRHGSRGTNIWGGQACVHVKPVSSSLHSRPRAQFNSCGIFSSTGRGIVVIAGSAFLRECDVSDCAATGVYVGSNGHGEDAAIAGIYKSSVNRNGQGHDPSLNNQFGEYVNRGHSGVYVQDGSAYVIDSEVSENTYTGISGSSLYGCRIVSFYNKLDDNEPSAIQLPPNGSESRSLCRVVGRGQSMESEKLKVQTALTEMESMDWESMLDHVTQVDVDEMEVSLVD